MPSAVEKKTSDKGEEESLVNEVDGKGGAINNEGGKVGDEAEEGLSGQEKRVLKERMDAEEKFHNEFENFLNSVAESPAMFSAPRLKYLREFVGLTQRFPEVYVSQDGDDTIQMPLPPEDRGLEPTEGYVKALTELRSGAEVAEKPVLSVYSVNPHYRTEVTDRVENPQNMKLTELRLVDGDGEQIHARLSNSLAEVGCMLKRGDKIRLDSHTELRYRINNKSPKMPALFIHKLSRVGSDPLEDEDVQPVMMACSKTLPSESADVFEPDEDDPVIDPRKDPKPCCNNGDRLCALYGIRFINCVCEAIPVENLNLATLKQNCYFATDELEDMTNSHKRNMIYWWYATNVYSIVGKGNIERLPLCLEYAIREKYPNPDGVEYKGNRGRKKSSKKSNKRNKRH